MSTSSRGAGQGPESGSGAYGGADDGPGAAVGSAPPGVDVSRPHIARMYDYLLGGSVNFPADRRTVEALLKVFPSLGVTARANRRFLARAVRHVARAGVRQFLDVGTGIPTSPNTYEIARETAPDARVVYVDNDPIVLAHARALVAGDPRGGTTYIEAELRRPHDILDSPRLREVLDLDRPVALLLLAVLHSLEDAERPDEIVCRLMAALPSGSFLIASHVTSQHHPEVEEAVRNYRANGVPLVTRDKEAFTRIAFGAPGLRLAEPGVVMLPAWHPDSGDVEAEWEGAAGVVRGRRQGVTTLRARWRPKTFLGANFLRRRRIPYPNGRHRPGHLVDLRASRYPGCRPMIRRVPTSTEKVITAL